jgi:hypothetical protein
MKKIVLFFICISSLTIQAQQDFLFNEDCEALTIGDIGTDITNANPGQGGWFTSATTANNSDFQIVNVGGLNNNVIKIIGSNGATTNNKILDQFVGDFWTNRTPGNNIAQVEFDFFTGPITTSKNFMRVALYDAAKTKILAGIRIEMNTLIIKGLSYASVSGILNNYSFSLGSSDVVLAPNTWYRFGFSFNSGTGDILFKEVGHNLFNIGIAGASINIPVSELFVFSTTQAGNTTSATGTFDTISFKADLDDTSLLSSITNPSNSNKFTITPNPVKDKVTIENLLNSIDSIIIYDLKGIEIKKIEVNQSLKNIQVDISDLSKGLYLIKIGSEKKCEIQKIIKE